MKRISKEEQLFQWLQKNVYSDLVVSRNQLSRWDCYSPSRKHRIELKCRERHYPELLVEKKKYDAMLAEASKHNDIPVYINSTPRGIYAFDMRDHNGFWELKKMPRSTQFANRERIVKEIGYFVIAEGHTLLKYYE